jgi:hypothetical protein
MPVGWVLDPEEEMESRDDFPRVADIHVTAPPAGTIRRLGVAAATVASVLYLLIGIGVLSVGESTSGEDAGLLGFGLVMAATFGVVAGLLLLVRRRAVLLAVAALQVVVLVGYVALSDMRDPPFDPWGLLIKVAQLVVLGVVAWLLSREPRPLDTRGPSLA